MAAIDKTLYVFAYIGDEWAPAGQLIMTEQGAGLVASSFAYGTRYTSRADPIEIDPVSLSMTAARQTGPTRAFPANGLTLFGGIRDAAPDAWGRRVIEAKLKAGANSLPESTYLLHAGSQRVGALDVRTALNAAPGEGAGAAVANLEYLLESADRIEQGEPVPAALEAIFVQGSGLGGARPKATVRDENGVLWLAKFPSRTDRMSITEIEAATLRLAAQSGIRVPPTRMVALGQRKIMMIRRFDRYWNQPAFEATPGDDALYLPPVPNATERRLPFISALTLLGCSEMDSRERSYRDVADAIRRYSHPDAIRRDNEELFRRMVFNILVSNDDDHLRNHGFIRDPRLKGWRLSPLYDVLPHPSGAYERFLHLDVGPQGKLANLDNAMASKEAFSLSRAEAAQAIAQVWSTVREWRVYFEQQAVPDRQIELVAPAFRHIDDVSSAELRKALP
jgi:serine/threonine-protein kinase HipA